jgi:hypothetical protein
MGPDFVRGMCHDIEDPTFDATAVATNPRAQVRPVHRPPRTPADRTPHCRWTVVIDESCPPVSESEGCLALQRSRAATLPLSSIDASEPGLGDYSGPLLSDLDFAAFSHSALVRIADEVCLQMHLLDRGFALAVAERVETDAELLKLRRKQLTGIAGIGAERLARALDLPRDPAGALRAIWLHPLLNPAAYVAASADAAAITVAPGPADEDAAWISLCGPDWPDSLRAIAGAVDPHLDARVTASPRGGWQVEVVAGEERPEAEEVAVTRFSTGASFVFEPRRSIPITPV